MSDQNNSASLEWMVKLAEKALDHALVTRMPGDFELVGIIYGDMRLFYQAEREGRLGSVKLNADRPSMEELAHDRDTAGLRKTKASIGTGDNFNYLRSLMHLYFGQGVAEGFNSRLMETPFKDTSASRDALISGAFTPIVSQGRAEYRIDDLYKLGRQLGYGGDLNGIAQTRSRISSGNLSQTT